jgi:predicted N-acyltransferase
VADKTQKVQYPFMANCRDKTSTRYLVQRFFDWLAETGEDALVVGHAQTRARIVRAVRKEAAA